MAVLAHGSPDDALSLLASRGEAQQWSSSAIEGAVFYLARHRPEESRSLILSQLKGKLRDRALEEAAIGAGQTSLEAGLYFASKLEDERMRYGTIAAIASGLIERDGESVVASLEGMPTEEAAKLLRMGGTGGQNLAAKVAARNPELAYSLLAQITFSSANRGVFENVLKATAARDPEGALSHIQTLPEGASRSAIVGAVFSTIAATSLDEALRLAAPMGDAGSLQAAYQAIGESVGRSLTNADAEAGWDWVNSLGGSARTHAMRGYAAIRVREEPALFAEQLEQLPPSTTWMAGAQILINELRQSDLERARQWEAAVQAFKGGREEGE